MSRLPGYCLFVVKVDLPSNLFLIHTPCHTVQSDDG